MMNYYYVECGAGLTPERNNTKFPFTRNHFMHPDQVYQFQNHYQNIDVYKTSMVYINPVWRVNRRGKNVIDAGRSLKWSDFYLDFDSDLETEEEHRYMKEDIEVAIRYLTLIFKFPESYVRIYFSGRKRYHLVIDENSIGIEPNIKLNQIFKEIGEEIKGYTHNETLDVGIYDDKRLFRRPNSIHGKSYLYKIPLTVDEFRKYTLEEVRELARNPRVVDYPTTPIKSRAALVFEDVIRKWTERAKNQEEFSRKVLTITDVPPCIKEMHERDFKETVDERNNSGTALASYYYQRNLPYGETLDILKKWGAENCVPALEVEDIKTIVDSVYNGGYRYGCNTFERLSGVCDRKNCPLFRRKDKEEEKIQDAVDSMVPY